MNSRKAKLMELLARQGKGRRSFLLRLNWAIKRLPERQREVLRRSCGMGRKAQTLSKIAVDYCVSVETIRRAEAKALFKLCSADGGKNLPELQKK